jgi:hypothetical protein
MFLSRAEELERRAAKERDKLKEELLRLADRYRQLAQGPVYDRRALRPGGHGKIVGVRYWPLGPELDCCRFR